MRRAFSQLAAKLPNWLLEVIHLIASLIGIFGFITGISSVPLLLSSANNGSPVVQTTWSGANIPYSISIPVFVISLLFVCALYYLLIVRISTWLCTYGLVSLRDGQYTMQENESGDWFWDVFFTVLGYAICALVFRVFFEIPSLQELRATEDDGMVLLGMMGAVFLTPASIIFVNSLARAARIAGATQIFRRHYTYKR